MIFKTGGKKMEKKEFQIDNFLYDYVVSNINKEYKIEKIGSIFFEKKGFDIFVPNI